MRDSYLVMGYFIRKYLFFYFVISVVNVGKYDSDFVDFIIGYYNVKFIFFWK